LILKGRDYVGRSEEMPLETKRVKEKESGSKGRTNNTIRKTL